jgi:DNA-binding NtrC family response regulator
VECPPATGRSVLYFAPLQKKPMPRKHIMVVEDDPKSLYALQAVLEDHGYTVSGCGNASDVEAVDTKGIDVAVIDLRLPDESGSKLAQRLLARNARLRLVFMTAYGVTELDDELKKQPVLVKPLSMDDLIRAIEA